MDSRRDFIKSTAAVLAGMPILAAANKLQALNVQDSFPMDDDPRYWEKIRDFFPWPKDEAYLNTGTIGATPKPVLDAVTGHLEEWARNITQVDWSDGGINIITGYFPHDSLRQKLAAILNVNFKDLALIKNAHMGMNLLAMGLDLRHGDEVIQTNKEHTGGKSGWEVRAKRDGIVIKQIELPIPIQNPEIIVQMVADLITPRTRVIALPHILSAPGDILPVTEICAMAREKGILTVLDGAQAIGHIPVNIPEIGCDAYFASPHKWMLAPAGSGVLYIRPELAPDIFTCMPSGAWDNHEDEGFRFTQRGTENMALMVGYEAAVDFHNQIGHERIVQRIKYLGDYLRRRLQEEEIFDIQTSVHPKMAAGLTMFGVKGKTAKELHEAMWQQGKLQPRSVGEQHIRYSTHIYNSVDEIERTIKIAKGLK